jgi:murein DD-endopeptidase MepM/ murein hydrolase activator NlpD
MMESLRQRAWGRLTVIFPERQIYIRSDGRVQFFAFSSQMQALLAAGGLLFLGWVAFTSVNVIFKDRIFAAKERHFEQMHAFYESRIADLQLSYDELNSSLILAQDRFKEVADGLEQKQQALAAVIEHKKGALTSLASGAALLRQSQDVPSRGAPAFTRAAGVGGVFDAMAADASTALVPPSSASDATGSQNYSSANAQLATASTVPASTRATFFGGAMQRLGALFHRRVAADAPNHPIVKSADLQSARILKLELNESVLLAEATDDVNKETTRLSRLLRSTGIDSKSLISRLPAEHGDGGHLATLGLSSEGTDDNFSSGIADAAGAIGKLDDVVRALKAVPLAAPTDTPSVSSGFGARVDPFNERLAFHSGVDLSGPKGADVRATGAGVVVFAGARGDYGNAVEIDHGYGIRTRYGHLSKIVAVPGTQVDKGTVIGRLGSTGRSTGPHVHYEVWYDRTVRDPEKFIKAGRDVFKE